jgi:ketosteroid isomerase-like protein
MRTALFVTLMLAMLVGSASVVASAPGAAGALWAAGAPGDAAALGRTAMLAAAAPGDAATPGAAAASRSGTELAAFKKAIRAKYDLKERAFATHDAETIVTQFYTPDVISVGEGEGIYVGRDQIRPLYQDVVKTNKVKVESVHTFVRGDAGWDWADFHVYPTDGKTAPFTFAILFLWARIDGQWMCKGDFFVNGSVKEGKLTPAPAAAAPAAEPRSK